MSSAEQWVLQLCHGYDGPFLDCARQYAVLFAGTQYKVCTVYLTGAPSDEVVQGSASDDVVFLGYDSRHVRGLRLGAIRELRKLVAGRNFRLCIAHRFKPIYVALLATRLPVIGVHHAFGVYKRPCAAGLLIIFVRACCYSAFPMRCVTRCALPFPAGKANALKLFTTAST